MDKTMNDDDAKRVIAQQLHNRGVVGINKTDTAYVLHMWKKNGSDYQNISKEVAQWALTVGWRMYDKGLGVSECLAIDTFHVQIKRAVIEYASARAMTNKYRSY